MSKTGCIISHEGIEYLCGLIRDINGLDTNLIDDLNIKSNGSYSSLKIKSLVDQALEDSKEYSDLLCSSLIKLTCEKTTTQPTLSNSEKNVIYLYSSDGNAPFEQYLKISDTELIDMGSTSISLNDYLTITDADSTYCKKTDFDTLKTALTTHTSDTDIHITSAERDKWNEVDNKVNKTDIVDNLTSTDTDKPLSANQGKVLKDEVDLKANDDEVVKKTDITTIINSSSTDTQYPSAKAVYDNTITTGFRQENSNYNIDTIRDYVTTHVNPTNNGDIGTYPTEFKWGTFLQLPAADYRTQILISEKGMYYRIMIGGVWQSWYKVNATEVTDTITYPKQTP